MERFLFNRDEFDLIYNCSMLSPEEWYAYGDKNVPIGIFFIASGVFYMVRFFQSLSGVRFLDVLYSNSDHYAATRVLQYH